MVPSDTTVVIMVIIVFAVIVILINTAPSKKDREEAINKIQSNQLKYLNNYNNLLLDLIQHLEIKKSQSEGDIFAGGVENYEDNLFKEMTLMKMRNDGVFSPMGEEFEIKLARLFSEGGPGGTPTDNELIINLLDYSKNYKKNIEDQISKL